MVFVFLEDFPMFCIQTQNYLFLGIRWNWLSMVCTLSNFMGYMYGVVKMVDSIMNNKTGYKYCPCGSKMV